MRNGTGKAIPGEVREAFWYRQPKPLSKERGLTIVFLSHVSPLPPVRIQSSQKDTPLKGSPLQRRLTNQRSVWRQFLWRVKKTLTHWYCKIMNWNIGKHVILCMLYIMSYFRNDTQLFPGKLIKSSSMNYHSVFNAKVLQRAQIRWTTELKSLNVLCQRTDYIHETYEYMSPKYFWVGKYVPLGQ